MYTQYHRGPWTADQASKGQEHKIALNSKGLLIYINMFQYIANNIVSRKWQMMPVLNSRHFSYN